MYRQPDASVEMSRRLPPPEAWKEPEEWLDMHTGLAKKTVNKLALPADERGFIMPEQAVKFVLQTFIRPDYQWTFSPGDHQTQPDRHHFHYERAKYAAENNDGDVIPGHFRELPSLIGYMPRQLHNVFHDFTREPAMPERDAMDDYVDAYTLARNAFRRVYETAERAAQAQHVFPVRRAIVAAGLVQPKDPDDQIGEDIMRTTFDRHFHSYKRAVDEFYSDENHELLYSDDDLLRLKPQVTVRKIGRAILRPQRYSIWRFTPDILKSIVA